MSETLKKLKKAREIIKNSDLKKQGRNEYSKFDYYTPEQVEALVDNACEQTKTIVLCNLKADDNGLFQTLDFIDLENGGKLSFEMRTKHGSITATNETQQMGGTDTYSERYIKMKVFQIKDNNLDFDSLDNRKKASTAPKKNLSKGGTLTQEELIDLQKKKMLQCKDCGNLDIKVSKQGKVYCPQAFKDPSHKKDYDFQKQDKPF